MKTRDQEQKEETLHQIEQKSPPVVEHNNSDKYVTSICQMELIFWWVWFKSKKIDRAMLL